MRKAYLLLLGLLVLILAGVTSCDWLQEEDLYANPPPTFQEGDLAGTWQASYYSGQLDDLDQLDIRADGTFRQVYHIENYGGQPYTYDTGWSTWSVERFPDGRIWLHLKTAHYYDEGVEFGESQGELTLASTSGVWPFWDPVGETGLVMIGELVLNVRVRGDGSGELILKHMRDDQFDDFESGEFHRLIGAPQ